MAVLAVIRSTYSRHFDKLDAETLQQMVNAWAVMFREYPYQDVMAGTYAWMASDKSGFPPVPGQIIDKIHRVKDVPDMGAEEAWSLVAKAAGRSNYYADEEFKKLPESVREVIRLPGQLREMAQMESGELHTVEKSHFIREYNAALARKQEERRYPEAVRKVITATRQNMIGGSKRQKLDDGRKGSAGSGC